MDKVSRVARENRAMFPVALAAILTVAAASPTVSSLPGPARYVSVSEAASARTTVPRADHVIVIIMENKSYDAARVSPFTAGLISSGTSFSSSFAVTHPSLPNYLALWSGSTQQVTSNSIPPRGSPFDAENLGHACEAAGFTWNAYSEDLPIAGFSGSSANHSLYARKHAPWTNFSNLDHKNELPFSELAVAESLGKLPNIAFVVPNQENDTHNSPVSHGDQWLSRHVPSMLRALGDKGLLVLTWDEDDSKGDNRILTVLNGPLVKQNYVSSRPISHYTLLRTLCDALRVTPPGAAAAETPITDVWRASVTVPSSPAPAGSADSVGRG